MGMSNIRRLAFCKQAKGKTIDQIDWVESDGGYWVLTFTDGSEVSFNRLMMEVVEERDSITPIVAGQKVHELVDEYLNKYSTDVTDLSFSQWLEELHLPSVDHPEYSYDPYRDDEPKAENAEDGTPN